jgi:hypothetical protein
MEHELYFVSEAVGTGAVSLVDHEDIGDLHEARLQGLYRVAGLWHQNHHTRIDGSRHLQLTLAHADCFDHDPVESEGIEHVGSLTRRGGQPPERSPRGQGADVYAGVQCDFFHSDPIAKKRAAGER